MKKYFSAGGLLILALIFWAGPAAADDDLATDITRETIVGPGSVQVQTGKDILMSFGATVRIIPTSDTDWDFGMSKEPAVAGGYLFGGLGKNFFKDHVNEAGWVNNSYIRNETKIYFNAMPRDRKWSFYAALEFDDILDTGSVDARGGKSNDTSNFGLERLQGTFALPYNMRFHAGWDVWHVDAIEAASFVYGDDNPGFWLTGDYDTFSFNVGYFKLAENDFQTAPATLNNAADDDRSLYAGYVTWKPDKQNKFQFFYLFDRIRNIPANDLLASLSGGLFGIATGKTPSTDSHHVGGYWIGNYGGLELFFEGVYQFGQAEDTGFAQGDFDISAYALAADISYDFKASLGFMLKPHLGFIYTSGDDDPTDDNLEGYVGVETGPRFSKRWGGENTIIGDTNLVLGTILYSYLPSLYGNGTPIATGGLQNTAGMGTGRGDNPGLTLISAGLTYAPRRFIIYKTNANVFRWNEDFNVTNMVNPLLGTTKVDSGYVGTEWDNELTLALSRHSFIKGQAAFFFPGGGVKDVTEALGAKSDDTAMRLAMEFIWNF